MKKYAKNIILAVELLFSTAIFISLITLSLAILFGFIR